MLLRLLASVNRVQLGGSLSSLRHGPAVSGFIKISSSASYTSRRICWRSQQLHARRHAQYHTLQARIAAAEASVPPSTFDLLCRSCSRVYDPAQQCLAMMRLYVVGCGH